MNKTRKFEAELRETISQLHRIMTAQEDLIDWYESEMERSQYDDEDVPDELAELEQAVMEAKL